MRRKLLAAGVVIVLLGGAAGAYKVFKEEDPPEKRGSANVEFDPTAKPEPAKPKKEVGEDWPTFGYDLQRTKVSPYDHKPPYRRTWRIDAHDTIEFPPSAAYGNVYVPQQKGLFFAVNGKTGKLLFRKSYKRCAASSPTISKGVIYMSYMDFVPCQQGASNPTGFVVAMDAKTGREKWRFKRKPFESTPLLRKGILYVGSWDGNVYAIRAKTGRKIWSYQTGDRVNTSGAYSNGRIFIANNSGTVYAINAKTGKLAWSGSEATEFFYAAPAAAYGRVFIGSTDGTMYAYGQKSGKLLWAKPLGTYIYSSAAIYDKKVYAGTYDGKFYALDAATGDTRWQADMPSAVHAPPVVMGGLVYAATCSSCGSAAARSVKTGKDSTTAFNARTGRKVWFNSGGKYASPIIADRDRVYFTGRSYQYALEPR
jgi:outer membrane protein assembly factor BamB